MFVELAGSIDSSILLIPGQYCRLELISADGKWLSDWQYTVGDQTVKHEAGTSVGSVMHNWRTCRSQFPELFARMLVWQSPTACVDSIVWSWQIQEEGARFAACIRVVDSLQTCWTEQAMRGAFAMQQFQACVPASCTPLCQVTDTGFSMPAKAAARKYHEVLRTQLASKARLEKTGCQMKVGARELAQTALVMHDRMVELNRQSNTVLAECRAGGWFHYRPTKAGLVKSSDQEWAACLTEGSSRMDSEFRRRRDSWVVNGVPNPIADNAVEKVEREISYWQDADPLLLSGEAEMDHLELRRLQAAMLHPSVRTDVEAELAMVALCCSQNPVRKRALKDNPSRAFRSASWRTELSKKRKLEDALWPSVTGKLHSKKLKKQMLKKLKGKLWKDLSKAKKRRTRRWQLKPNRKRRMQKMQCHQQSVQKRMQLGPAKQSG